MKTLPRIQAVTGRARSWLTCRSLSTTSSGSPRPWMFTPPPAAAARQTATRVSSPAARANAEQVLADLQNNLKREASPRLIVKPAKAANATLALPAAKAKPAPAASKQEAPKFTHRRGLEYLESCGRLQGLGRAELALMRELEAKQGATANRKGAKC